MNLFGKYECFMTVFFDLFHHRHSLQRAPPQCEVSVEADQQPAATSILAPHRPPTTPHYGPLFIGGLPKALVPAARASSLTGLKGCVRHLAVNQEERLVYQDAVEGQNIVDCPVAPCSHRPCVNNGSCVR